MWVLWPAGVVWSADEGVAALAGRSGHAAEKEGDRGQTAVGQQAWQAAAGQRGDRWGTTGANRGQQQQSENGSDGAEKLLQSSMRPLQERFRNFHFLFPLWVLARH